MRIIKNIDEILDLFNDSEDKQLILDSLVIEDELIMPIINELNEKILLLKVNGILELIIFKDLNEINEFSKLNPRFNLKEDFWVGD